MPINHSIIPKSTPLVGFGGGFGSVGGWGRAFGETIIANRIMPDVRRPGAPNIANAKPRVSLVRERPRLSAPAITMK